MRQPSAEDLDAAQQLISSARGAREALDYHMQANINSHNHDSLQQNGQRDAGTDMENTRDGTNSVNEGAGNSKSSTGSSSNQTPSFPSHSCRYAFPSFVEKSAILISNPVTVAPRARHYGEDRLLAR